MKLKLDGQNINLDNNVVEITKQLFDFGDISQRYLGTTNTFSFPRTNNNSEFLKNPSAINTDNESFQKYYNGSLLDSNIFLFKGQGILEESNTEYKLQLIEDVKVLFDSLKGDIKDLDFESSDFAYGASTYGVLKKENATAWIWAVMSQHENKDVSKSLLSNNLAFTRPGLRVKKIWDAIFNSTDWDYEFLDTVDEFERSAITVNHKQFFVTSYQKTLNATYSPTGATNITGLDINDFEFNVTTTNTTIDIGSTETKFRLRGPVIITGEVKIIIEAQSSPGTDDVFSQEFILDSSQTEIDITSDSIKTSQTSNIVEIKVDGSGSIEFTDTLLYTIIEEEKLGNFEDDLLQGYKVKVYDNIQDISQIDFLQNLWVQYGMLFKIDPYLKKLQFYTVENINKLNSLDWSDRMMQKTETIKGKIGNYGQKSYLLYDNDDETGPTVGREFFLVNDSTLENEKDIIKLFWGASKEAVIDSETQADMPVYTDTDRSFDANPRIFTYRDGSTEAISQFDEITWTNLYANYYQILNSLYRTRFIECMMTLKRSDFINYDFRKPVYIEYFKSYFLVQRIDSYIPGVPVKCELIKFD